uniref:Uncharacterized protein n=1 Tax=Rhizophora mucronata TaxID=61149 RepID=A0A2P2P6R5_RHIMU
MDSAPTSRCGNTWCPISLVITRSFCTTIWALVLQIQITSISIDTPP